MDDNQERQLELDRQHRTTQEPDKMKIIDDRTSSLMLLSATAILLTYHPSIQLTGCRKRTSRKIAGYTQYCLHFVNSDRHGWTTLVKSLLSQGVSNNVQVPPQRATTTANSGVALSSLDDSISMRWTVEASSRRIDFPAAITIQNTSGSAGGFPSRHLDSSSRSIPIN